MTDTLQFDFVRDQKTELPIADTFADKISGGTFIVTGSNTGLGFEAAQHFVRLGAAKLILAVRSTTKGEEAKSRIETSTGIKGVAEVWELDMSSYSSIVAFGKKLQGLDRLDAIVENAAVALDKWSTADKGFETTMIVNVTGTMLLAGLVMPKLQESAKKFGLKTHLSIIGSGVAHFDEARDELQKAVDAGGDILNYFNVKSHGLKGRYPVSKLVLLYAAREYASLRPVASTGVVVNYVNPGLCQSDLARHVEEERRKSVQTMRDQIGRSTEVGSRTLVHSAFAGDESHGKYLSECVVKDEYNPNSITGENGQKLQKLVWESVTEHINGVAPGTF